MKFDFKQINAFLKENFTKKINIQRLIMFLVATFVVIICSLPVHSWALHAPDQKYNVGNFIEINIVLNAGISFGAFRNNVVFVYSIQTIMALVLICVVLFTRIWYFNLTVSIATVGGLFNLIDRMCPKSLESSGGGIIKNSVLDYFSFFGKSAIFNLPDVFIIAGVISFCCCVIYKSIIDEKKWKKTTKK